MLEVCVCFDGLKENRNTNTIWLDFTDEGIFIDGEPLLINNESLVFSFIRPSSLHKIDKEDIVRLEGYKKTNRFMKYKIVLRAGSNSLIITNKEMITRVFDYLDEWNIKYIDTMGVRNIYETYNNYNDLCRFINESQLENS